MYFRFIDKFRKDGYVEYIQAPRGSQLIFDAIDEIVGDKLHTNGIPVSIEADGWADDDACPGDIFETEDFVLECITEEEFFEVWRNLSSKR